MITHKELENVEYLKPSFGYRYEGKVKGLWWPFWAWRVLAPEKPEEVDILLELMLRLINAGCTNRERLTELSCLESEFVAHLLELLTRDGFIDGWVITEAGKSYLEKGFKDSSELKSFYILQDAGTKKVLPRVFDRLHYIENISLDGNYPSFTLNRKTGKQIRPFLIREFSGQVVTPTADQIYEAIKKHRLLRNKVKQAGFNSEPVGIRPDQVSLLDDNPVAVYMNIKLFVDRSEQRTWFLSDPSGLMPSLSELNQVADERLNNDKSFAKLVSELLGESNNDKEDTYPERQRKVEEQAKVQLMSDYPWTSKIALLEKYVLRMLEKKISFEKDSEVRPEALEKLIGEFQNVYEALLKVLINPSEKNSQWEILVGPYKKKGREQIKDLGRRQKKEIYRQSGVIDDAIAWNLSSVSSGQVREAMRTGEQSLRQLIAALVLSSPVAVRGLTEAFPDWIERMLDLANDRNKISAHANLRTPDVNGVKKHEFFVDSLLKYIEEEVTNG